MAYSEHKVSRTARREQHREATRHTAIQQSAERYTLPWADRSTLTVSIRPENYSASVIARAVEDCDAHLLGLELQNTPDADNPSLTVSLTVSHRSPMAVARSLDRYGYELISASSSDDDNTLINDDTLSRRVAELLRRLEV